MLLLIGWEQLLSTNIQTLRTFAAVAGAAGCALLLPPPGAVLGRPGYCSVVSGDEYGSSSLSLTPRGPAITGRLLAKGLPVHTRSHKERQNDRNSTWNQDS